MRTRITEESRTMIRFAAGMVAALAVIIAVVTTFIHMENTIAERNLAHESVERVEPEQETRDLDAKEVIATLIQRNAGRALRVDPDMIATVFAEPQNIRENSKTVYSSYIHRMTEENPIIDALVTVIDEIRAADIDFGSFENTPIHMEG